MVQDSQYKYLYEYNCMGKLKKIGFTRNKVYSIIYESQPSGNEQPSHMCNHLLLLRFQASILKHRSSVKLKVKSHNNTTQGQACVSTCGG